MNALNIEIFSDLICPWCYIGRRRLEDGLKILGANELPNIIWRPFELNPDMPKAGLHRKAYRAAKFGSWERSQAMDREIAEIGRTLGLEFNYDRVLITPNTRAGHRLLWWARDKGLQDALADALFRAYFTEGRDIGKNEVLTQIAAEAGLSATDFSRFVESDKGLEEVLKEEVEGKQRGLNGVPFFVINGVPAFSGAQHPERLSRRFVRFSTWMSQSAAPTRVLSEADDNNESPTAKRRPSAPGVDLVVDGGFVLLVSANTIEA
jgi:predicted DsbA family dithiol-disulfide isomerase